MLSKLLEAINSVEAATIPRDPFMYFDKLTITEPVVCDVDFVIDDSELIVFPVPHPPLKLEFLGMWENV